MHIYEMVWSIFNGLFQLDDWVLCRIYKKSHGLSSTSSSAAAAATASDQDQEEEETEQFIQDALLVPALRSPAAGNNNYNNTLQPQKSCSFSNLFDAMDYSMLSSFLADNQCNTAGYEPSPFSFGNFEPPLTNNNYTNSSSSNMLLQKLPSPVPNVENKLKRQYSSIDEDNYLNPPKKFISSCSYNNSTSQSDHMTHYNFLNQSFINQSLLLSPHLQFQGWNWKIIKTKKDKNG